MIRYYFAFMMTVCFQQFLMGQIPPIFLNVNDFQTGSQQLCGFIASLPCTGSQNYITSFASAFTETPQVQIYFTSNHDSGFSRIQFVIDVAHIQLNQFSFYSYNSYWSNQLSKLSISWVATTNKKIALIKVPITLVTGGVQNEVRSYNFPQQYIVQPAIQILIQSLDAMGKFSILHTDTLSYCSISLQTISSTIVYDLDVTLIVVDLVIEDKNNLNLEINSFTADVTSSIQSFTTQLALIHIPLNASPQIITGYLSMGLFSPYVSVDITLTSLTLNFITLYPGQDCVYVISYSCLTQLSCVLNAYYKNYSCQCNNGYYLDKIQQLCPACDSSCSICGGPSNNQCLGCDPLAFRQLSQANTCDCYKSYYVDSQDKCQACHLECLSCFNGADTGCLSCDPLMLRKYLQIGTNNQTCVCSDGYFNLIGNSMCQTCASLCVTCFGQYSNQCLSCDAGMKRSLNLYQQCNCDLTYYEDENLSCQQCHFSCMTCTNSQQISCLSCQSMRTFVQVLSQNTCECPIYYFENQESICLPCHYSCLTCQGLGINDCITCQTSVRTLASNQCQCDIGSFDDGKNQLCQQCDKSCLTCFGTTSSDCSSCSMLNSNRTFIQSQCQCVTSFYEDGINPVCQACDRTCLTCSGPTFINCLSCSTITAQRNLISGQCQCTEGLFGDEINSLCQICHKTCLTCVQKTSMDCLSCATLTLKRQLVNNQCNCITGFFDDRINPICQRCDETCLSCSGKNDFDCLSCQTLSHRELIGNKCPCIQDYEEVSGKCQVIISTSRQPPCNIVNCAFCSQSGCRSCKLGFFLSGTYNLIPSEQLYCLPCNKKCLQCHGPLGTQCLSCRFIQIDKRCKLCSEVLGLQVNSNGQCVSICGDGIVYQPQEQCDSGKFNGDAFCSSECLNKTNHNHGVSLNFVTNSSAYFTYNNTRQAILLFKQHQTNNFKQWQFRIPNYNPLDFNITLSFDKNQLIIIIVFNQSITGGQLEVIAPADSLITKKHLQAIIPDFTMVSNEVQQETAKVLTVTHILINFIIIIMGVALITGGFDLIWELLDLLQLLSYLKYLNVDYPYNVDMFFNYLSEFNFSFIIDNLPYMDELQLYLNTVYGNSGAVQPSYKMGQDGYSSLFLYNFIGIVFGWIMALVAFYLAKVVSFIFNIWANLDQFDQFTGWRRSLYILRFRVSYFIVSLLSDFNQNFFFNGLFRTYVTSDYALNFILMMELKQINVSSLDMVLASSSCFALVILIGKILVAYIIMKLINNHQGTQLQQISLRYKIGSVIEGYNLSLQGAKYFGVQDLVKKFLFMFSLVIFYDSPIYQVAGIMFTSLITSLLYYKYKPNKEGNDFWKTFSCEILTFFSTCLIFLYAIDADIKILNDDRKLNIGWIIILFCIFILMVQILIDMKLQVEFIVYQFKKIKRMLIYYYKRQKMIKEYDRLQSQNKLVQK